MVGEWTFAELWRDRRCWWGANFTGLRFGVVRGETFACQPDLNSISLRLGGLIIVAFAVVMPRELVLRQAVGLLVVSLMAAIVEMIRSEHFAGMVGSAASPVPKNLPNPSIPMAGQWAIPFFQSRAEHPQRANASRLVSA
jgi:hypothetical protein